MRRAVVSAARKLWRGGEFQVSPTTVPRMFVDRCEATPDAPAVRHRHGTVWRALTYREFGAEVRELALGFLALGLQPGEVVLLASQTRYEWNLVDFAALMAGGIVVPAFPTLFARSILHQASDAMCSVAVVEDGTQLDKVLEVRDALPNLRLIVTIDRTGREDGGLVHGLEAVRGAGANRRELERELGRRLAAGRPEDVASIVYTSGTTGLPRGVELTHGNFIAATGGALKVLPIREGSVIFAILPLAHVYQRVVNIGAVMRGAETAYSTPKTMARDLLEVRPTTIAGVPRLYERIYERIEEEVRRRGRAAQRIFAWARRVAIDHAKAKSAGTVGAAIRMGHGIAERLVYRKIRAGLGGRIELFVSGASALREDLAWFFNGIGTTLLEGYGLTETTAPVNVNPLDRVRPGTVGPPIPGVEETLARDGEILVRGPPVFPGYHNLPEDNALAFTEDGWFRTGDYGAFDADGYLRFRGRKKELIKLSTAKFVRPTLIEERLKENPLIEDAVVIGDDRKFATALVLPYFPILLLRLAEAGIGIPDRNIRWGTNLVGDRVVDEVDPSVLAMPAVRTMYGGIFEVLNRDLEPHERIVRYRLVPCRFTIDGGEYTPTLKVRRDVVIQKYAQEIDALYA